MGPAFGSAASIVVGTPSSRNDHISFGWSFRPRFAGSDESVSAALAPTPEETAFAERTLAAAGFAGLVYARVVVMRDDAGRAVLSELELIEPSLFLEQHPPALARLADALVRAGRRP